jgi:hypothetical protein
MPINTTYLAADFAAAIAELPVTASYGGATVEGIIETQKREDGLEMTGQNVVRETTLFLPATATLPAERSRIDIQRVPNGGYESWRVVSSETSADNVHHSIVLARWARGT